MKGLLAGIAILLLLGVGSIFIGLNTVQAPVPQGGTSSHTYSSQAAGIAFEYPENYKVEERGDSFEGHSIVVMTLIDKDAFIPDMSEGPPAISIIEVPNPQNIPLEQWIKTKSISNFSLSPDRMLATTTVEGEEAFAYRHSGLYESDAVAVAHAGKIYVLSVGWAEREAPIRTDFQNLLKTISWR